MKKIALTIGFLFCVFAVTAQQDLLKKGNKHLDQKKYKEAEKAYKEGIKQYPDFPSFKTQLGFTYLQQNKFEEAEKILTAVLEEHPTDMPANWYAGIMYFYQEENRKALPRFEKAIRELQPQMGQFASACWFIGQCYENLLYLEGITQKETDRMMEVYEAFVELRPDAPETQKIKTFLENVAEHRPPETQNKWKAEPDQW